jgi:hypothetical protein
MDEINPYATPGSSLHSDASAMPGRPRGYGWYKWCSLIYGLLFIAMGLATAARHGLDLSVVTLVAMLIILAPLISYLLVAARWWRLFYAWISLHLLVSLLLTTFGFERASTKEGFEWGFILFVAGSNLLCWLAGLYFHWRLGKK